MVVFDDEDFESYNTVSLFLFISLIVIDIF